MTTRTIVIHPEDQVHPIPGGEGMRMKRTITEAIGFTDRKLFRYLMRPLKSGDDTYVLTFDGVCSPADLEEWPADTPDTTRSPWFCRLDYVDIVFRSSVRAAEAAAAITREANALLAALSTMDTLAAQADIVCGDPLPDSSSSSMEA